MNPEQIIERTEKFIRKQSYGEASGHDWFHIERVYRMARYLAEREHADLFTVSMAALLHDLDDWKFSEGTETDTSRTEAFLKSLPVEGKDAERILTIVRTLSYKGGVADSSQKTIEGKVVQDADRLDAIGAIGIARAFAYGGKKNRLIYDPQVKPAKFTSLKEVKITKSPTINHFYEKLLKLKDLMNTETARQLAQKRHAFMLQFLEEFYSEWNFEPADSHTETGREETV